MAKLRRRHLDGLQAKLEDITDTIVAMRLDVEREAEARALMTSRQDVQACPPQLAQTLERVAALLTGVTVALERMGGTTLPAFREDISSLRAQMSEFQHEMADYRAAQMQLANLAEALKIRQALGILPAHRDEAIEALKAMADEDDPQPAIKSKRRPGRPRKPKPAEDTSQKLIDEVEQEVVEE